MIGGPFESCTVRAWIGQGTWQPGADANYELVQASRVRPGLVVHRTLVKSKAGVDHRWTLTHEQSGVAICQWFASQGGAAQFAVLLEERTPDGIWTDELTDEWRESLRRAFKDLRDEVADAPGMFVAGYPFEEGAL